MDNILEFSSCRPFGVEIELNNFNDGIYFVANLLSKTLNKYVEIRDHGYTNWYKGFGHWVLKPDNSCGLEVCSPIMKGWYDLMELCTAIDCFRKAEVINADTKCSLHVHIDVSDLNQQQKVSVLKHWIRCEPVFFDSIPLDRKENKYCKFIGLWDVLQTNMADDELFEIFGSSKYGSVNTYHMYKGDGSTIEFRLGENVLCQNSFFTKNWVKLLINFVEISSRITTDTLSWMDVKEVFQLLRFLDFSLSAGMAQMRDWFLGRLYYNSLTCLDGFFNTRIITKKQIGELLNTFPKFNLQEALYPSFYDKAVYSKFYSY